MRIGRYLLTGGYWYKHHRGGMELQLLGMILQHVLDSTTLEKGVVPPAIQVALFVVKNPFPVVDHLQS